jgi:hypothetical protein
MPILPDSATAAILDDDRFWADVTYEPTQADWDDLHDLYEAEADALDPEASPSLVGHSDWSDAAADALPPREFAPWYDYETPEFWAS